MSEPDDIELHPIDSPLQRATDAIRAAAEDLGYIEFPEPKRLAEAALAASATSYVPPDRPVDVVVSIADEDGLEVEQTLRLTREQAAQPALLGGAVGHATASALAGFYIADDGSAGDDARVAAATALDSR